MKIQNEKIEGLYKSAYLHMRYAELVLQYDLTLTENQKDRQLKTRDRQHDRLLAFLESLYALNYFLDDTLLLQDQAEQEAIKLFERNYQMVVYAAQSH